MPASDEKTYPSAGLWVCVFSGWEKSRGTTRKINSLLRHGSDRDSSIPEAKKPKR